MMAERKHGRDPERDETRAQEATTSGTGVDPELELDLGAELELRGDQLESELEAARSEAAKNLETAMRVQAEFENYRKRVARDQADLVARASERVVAALLPVLDNLERAIDHVTAGGDTSQLLTGVEMVHQQMLDVLAKEGLEVIDPFGEPFDPTRHQAVAQRADEEVDEGTIVEVFQKGYVLGGKVLRPAMVVVSARGTTGEE